MISDAPALPIRIARAVPRRRGLAADPQASPP